ncbi:hypothetical protein [Paraburkholderia strydomiana]|uniref:hypothetical protein n=1 Tax=Paraburkholderia strydomiana TaxID=1245417 RepID=UPI0038BC39D7
MAQRGAIYLEGGIGRASVLPIAVMRLVDVALTQHPEYGMPVFHCHKLHADITPATCANNFANSGRYASCEGCQVGAHHSNVNSAPIVIGRHVRAAANHRITCVRCQRSNANGSESFVGRIRMIVGRQICISCWNREREVMRGANSKDATPVKWAHLRPATLTIEQDGKQKTISAGLRTGRAECERLVAQAHPGATLVECLIDGKTVQPGEDEPEVSVSRKHPEGTKVRKVMPRPVASVADGDGDEFGYRVPTSTRKTTNAKPLPVASDAEAFSNDDDDPPMRGWPKPAEPFALAAHATTPNIEREPASEPESEPQCDGSPAWREVFCEASAHEWEPSAADKVILNRGIAESLVDYAVHGYPKRSQEAGEAFPGGLVADALAEVAEAVPDDSEHSEPAIEIGKWTDVFVSSERGQQSVAQIARERGVIGDQVARELGILDEPAPVPVKQPAPEPLTRKERRAYERTARRAAKKAARAAAQVTAPSIKQTARAYMGVLFGMAQN